MDEVEREMQGFEARVFQHELDHLNGNHILDMNISQGDVEFLKETEYDYPNFQEVCYYYILEVYCSRCS